jgi:hypothetical protein
MLVVSSKPLLSNIYADSRTHVTLYVNILYTPYVHVTLCIMYMLLYSMLMYMLLYSMHMLPQYAHILWA